MNVKRLIDALVQQTTVLIAQLATTAGIRAPLSHVANQVFHDLAEEIERQGVTRKVAADMFGLALRSYQLKVQRLEESLTEREASLWEAVLEYIRDHEMVRREDVLTHFSEDPQQSIKSILKDLVDSGLVFQTGSGRSRSYRAASEQEIGSLSEDEAEESAPFVVWLAVYRAGPATFDELRAHLGMESDALRRALSTLLGEGRVSVAEDEDEREIFSTDKVVISQADEAGWEAAVFDHFNAMVSALTTRLRGDTQPHFDRPVVGGSTYTFDVGDEHPLRDEVLALLDETREQVSDLRERVTNINEERDWSDALDERVTFYFGQTITRNDTD